MTRSAIKSVRRWEAVETNAPEKTGALHDAGARSAYASIWAELLDCACLFWRFSSAGFSTTFLVVYPDEAVVVTHRLAAYIAEDENHEPS